MLSILWLNGVMEKEEKLRMLEKTKMKMIHIYLIQKMTVFKLKVKKTMNLIWMLLDKNKEKQRKKMQFQLKLMENIISLKNLNQELLKKPKNKNK